MIDLTRFNTVRNWLRLAVLLCVFLAMAAGYYHSLYTNEQKKYLRLEDKFVRVRSQLGTEETQRLIDQSYD